MSLVQAPSRVYYGPIDYSSPSQTTSQALSSAMLAIVYVLLLAEEPKIGLLPHLCLISLQHIK